MQKGENEPLTGSLGRTAFWADVAANTRAQKWERCRGGREEQCGAEESGYFSKGKDKVIEERDVIFVSKL